MLHGCYASQNDLARVLRQKLAAASTRVKERLKTGSAFRSSGLRPAHEGGGIGRANCMHLLAALLSIYAQVSDGGPFLWQTGVTKDGSILRVREVWDDNLDAEFAIIRDIVEAHPFVAMDTEFPGVVARPVGNFKSSREYHYKALKMNVDMLKLIQLGLTFTDAAGNLPRYGGELCVWQFNFKGFRLADDVYAQDSIDLLKQSGIDFNQNETRGIDVMRFGELLMTSGIVLNDEVRWITFHRWVPMRGRARGGAGGVHSGSSTRRASPHSAQLLRTEGTWGCRVLAHACARAFTHIHTVVTYIRTHTCPQRLRLRLPAQDPDLPAAARCRGRIL